MRKKIKIATKTRGFWQHLSNYEQKQFELSLEKNYEIANNNSFINSIAKSKLFDYLGIIQVISSDNVDCDFFGSFNRFLDVNKNYFIYVENPTALYHYRTKRGTTFLGRRKIEKCAKNKQLKAIVCMSKACETTFDSLCFNTKNKEMLKTTIYPLVPKNKYVTNQIIKERCFQDELKLLYIAQGTRFISKGFLNILEMLKRMEGEGSTNILLTVVTQITCIPFDILSEINSMKSIKLIDFTLSYDEMEQLYTEHSVLIYPTSDDSYSLTVLEAIKAGLPVISTRLYAIPEMVKDNINGFLTEPQWYFFDKNNIPNSTVWNDRENTIYSRQVSNDIVNFLIDKVSLLNDNRQKLEEMSLNSLELANNKPFNEDYIISQWDEVIEKLQE